MKTKYFENTLALLGVLAILIGVSAASTTALATDFRTVEIHNTAPK